MEENTNKQFCPKCGTELETNAAFCPKCGERKTVKESENLAVCKNCGAKLKIAKKK